MKIQRGTTFTAVTRTKRTPVVGYTGKRSSARLLQRPHVDLQCVVALLWMADNSDDKSRVKAVIICLRPISISCHGLSYDLIFIFISKTPISRVAQGNWNSYFPCYSRSTSRIPRSRLFKGCRVKFISNLGVGYKGINCMNNKNRF